MGKPAAVFVYNPHSGNVKFTPQLRPSRYESVRAALENLECVEQAGFYRPTTQQLDITWVSSVAGSKRRQMDAVIEVVKCLKAQKLKVPTPTQDTSPL